MSPGVPTVMADKYRPIYHDLQQDICYLLTAAIVAETFQLHSEGAGSYVLRVIGHPL